MDLKKLQTTLFDTINGTGTGTGTGKGQPKSLTDLPTNVLEAFIPGYRLISQFILDAFGFDIAVIVSIGVLLFAAVTAASYTWRWGYAVFNRYFMSSVYIDDADDLFYSVLEWIASQRISKVSRSVKAVTQRGSTWDDPSADDKDGDDDASLDESGIFNFTKWAANVPPRFEPYFGTHHFWHDGRLFFFHRSRREIQMSQWQQRSGEEELIELKTIGRTTLPIKALLHDIKVWSLEKEKAMTVIRRPAPKDRMRFAGAWMRVSTRPSRPMDTVVLDSEQKEKVLADINEYLHPSSPRWYATRGIPYRRGYLFHGPPGSGKTSLSFALAGVFGLDIHVISLLEPTLTESDLNNLFNNLPRRCIVLLEDIDTAGLLRIDDDGKSGKKATSKDEPKTIAADIAKAIKDGKADDTKKGISLSGLLNAIDGVATHEGRVLVMTTNHPEKLDEALVRPGRVDMQVKFELATHDQMRELFVRMYSSKRDRPERHRAAKSSSDSTSPFTATATANGSVHANGKPTHKRGNSEVKVNGVAKERRTDSGVSLAPWRVPPHSFSTAQLEALADQFAALLPEKTLSPAEVQGFLLTRKREPARALEQVGEWRDALLEAKERKAKVVDV